MFELLHELTNWLIGLADSEWAVLILAAASFAEAIIFPVPPDPLLIAIAIAQPENAVWLGALTTVASVAGAVVGHALGGRLGRPLINRIASERRVATVERMFQKYGAWAIVAAAVTPVPYKVFAITAGVLGMNRTTFIVASLIGRGLRFLTLGVVIYFYGESVKEFIDENFNVLTIGMGLIVVVIFALVLGYARIRAARHTDEPEAPAGE